ncbi:hypothetical protein DFH28DRAFT_1051284 [Melampsora americana]|nr:hypothetical protein DFH28DRAFT_1051284 [Melampsora americana]
MKSLFMIFCVHFLTQLGQIGKRASAMEMSRMQHVDDQFEQSYKGVFQFCKTKEDPQVYLGRSLKERQELGPLLDLCETKDEDTYCLIGFDLINRMLQSNIQRWPTMLQKIFKLYTQQQEAKDFWRLLSHISDFMPTPALQVTRFELEKERAKPWYVKSINEGWELHRALENTISKCLHSMQEHIVSLNRNDFVFALCRETEKIMNIFTSKEQKKLGEHRLFVEKDWFGIGEKWVLQNWALRESYMDVYMNVQGVIKGVLETQVVLFTLIKAEKINTLKILGLPHGLTYNFDNWVSPYVEKLTKNLVDSINSLDQQQIQYCAALQEKYTHGLLIHQFQEPNDNKNIMRFWSKNLRFYLEIKSLPQLNLMMHPLENLIRKNPKHMEYVMKEFKKNPPPSRAQSQTNLLSRFLEFFLDNTPFPELREIAVEGLAKIDEIDDDEIKTTLSTLKTGILPWNVLYYLSFFRKVMTSDSMGDNIMHLDR